MGAGSFHSTPNGLPGVETLFPLLYTYGVQKGRISLQRLIDVLATNPAAIFGLSHKKGRIQIGHDADLVIWNPSVEKTILNKNLHSRADWSPYDGMKVQGDLDYTIQRGKIIVEKNEFSEIHRYGQLLRSDENM
jgi:dihydropyrimidinase